MSKTNGHLMTRQQRNRWLVGGSSLAAAAALAFAPGQGFAQSLGPSRDALMPQAPVMPPRSPDLRQLPSIPMPQEVSLPAVRQPARITPAGITLDAPILARRLLTPPASVVRTPVARPIAAQQIPTGDASTSVPLGGGPVISAAVPFSSTPAPSNGDTNTAGINVAASANYFASEVDFRPGAGQDVVELFASSAIINWTTNIAGTAGGEVTFLGAGQQLNFTSALGDYTVLNRIFTPAIDAAVRIDGTVSSSTFLGSGTGGNVWFYSPGGLIVGASSVFNVGSLVLTSSNLEAIGSTMNFTGVAEANTAVVIESGAQISALEQDSYFAVVAPRVQQGGSVNVNGSVAYVGAEQAQLTINGGLFDISVGVGSADANGVVHTGTTTGSAATPTVDMFGQISDADARGIYMVAVPKNTAISMLVGGTIGYQPAESASLADNGSIILSAGAGIAATGGAANPAAAVDTVNAVPGGSVLVEGASFTSSAQIFASEAVNLTGSGTGLLSSGGDGREDYDIDVNAGGDINLTLADDAVVDILGNLTFRSGGDIIVDLTSGGGSMFVGGNFTLETLTRGADDFANFRDNGGTGIGADAVSGSIALTVGGGTNLDVGGGLLLNSAAQGGKGEIRNGSATAGDILVNFETTGSVDIGGFVLVSAQALSAQLGKDGGNGPGGIGSDSTAGDVTLNFASNSASAAGLSVDASAEASLGDNSAIAQSNDSIAGGIAVNVVSSFNQFGDINLTARSIAAASFDASGNETSGQSERGSVSLTVANTDTSVDVSGSAFIDVSTEGVVAPPTGNSVSVVVDNVGTSGGLFIGGTLGIDTTAGGGAATGLSEAGSVLLQASGGQLVADFLDIYARASETGQSFSSAGSGQDFQGGDVTLRADAGGEINFAFAFVDTEATGALQTAGNAAGGAITLEAADGTITFQSFANLSARAAGGAGTNPADGTAAFAQGGDITVSISGAGGSMNLADIFLAADASILFDVEGSSSEFSGDGGSAQAGDIVFNLDGGSLTADSLGITSNGFGGVGGGLPPGTAPFSTGLPPAGDGGLGQGGTITFNLDGTNMTVGSLDILADGLGGNGAFGDFEAGTRGGRGGDAVGGTVVFNALSGTLTAGSITVAARGNGINGGGAGGSAFGSEGGDGGNATGGSATFNLTGSAVIDGGTVLVTTDGYGGRGGNSFATFTQTGTNIIGQDAGAGGNGTGGTTTFNHVSGAIDFTSLTASARGIGGDGGGSFGFSTGDATGAGGAGGNAAGGIASINLDQDDGSDPVYFVTADAIGGAGGGGLASGNGGSASGGTASLAINNSAITLDAATISARATGGNAGFTDTIGGLAGAGGDAVGGSANLDIIGALASVSSSNPLQIFASAAGGTGGGGAPAGAFANGGDGGAGGSAAGGTARIGVSGPGAGLTVDPDLAVLSADAVGGEGGQGGFSFDAIGGAGGQGGDAVGGALTLEASSGTTLTIFDPSGTYVMTSAGIGGGGGQGGNGGFSPGSDGGIGGNGGIGTGGSPTLRAIGGTIIGGDIVLAGLGIGGDGGIGGTFGSSVPGPSGNGGAGQGGSPVIELLNGSPGIVNLGDVAILSAAAGGTGTVNGTTVAGRIDIRDLSSDAGGVFSFGSLVASVSGDAASVGGGFFLTGGSEANTVVGNQSVNVVGDISYTFAGDGQLLVGGATDLTATGNILVTHTGNTGGVVSLSSGGNFTATAGADFIADAQSIIGSGGAITIRAEGEAEANDLRAVPNILFSAGRNAVVNNASVTGPPVTVTVGVGTAVFNGISISAGGNNDPSFEQFDPNFNAAITGDVTSTGFVSVTAGGNALFAAGSGTASDNGLTVRTGDDILIASGALVEAGANPTTTPSAANPFANFTNLVLDAGALARSGELLAGPLTPLASIVSAGTIEANDFAAILTANAIDGSGGAISASSLAADIVDAPNAGVAQGNDAGLLGARCLEGNICLGSISADNRIEIGQNSNNDVIQLVVEQAAISANDVLITIRNDIVMGSAGIPTTIDAANTFFAESLTGDVNLLDAVINSDQISISAAGSLLGSGSLTSANDIGITVGQDLNALLIDTGGQLTTVAGAGGALEAEYTVAGSINVGTYNQGAATALRVVAGAGNSFGAIGLAGPQDITLIAGDTGAGDVFLGTANGAGSITLSGDNVGFADLSSVGAINASATGAITGGNLAAGGDVDLAAQAIDIGDVTSGGSVIASASTGNAGFGTVDAANDITITAVGTPSLTNAISGGNTSITGSGVSLASGTIGGDLALTATTGDIRGNGVISVAGGIALDAAGAIGFGTLTASGGDFTAVAGGDMFFTGAGAAGTLDFTAGGSIAATGSVTGTDVFLTAGDTISAGAVSGDTTEIFGPNGITIGTLAGGTALLQAATGAVSVTGDIDLSGLLEAAGRSLLLRSTNGLTVRATATAGDIDIAVGGDLDLRGVSASGDISLTTSGGSVVANATVASGVTTLPPGALGPLMITSSGGDIAINAANGFTVNSAISAANALTINVGGIIDLQAAASGATIGVVAGDINIGTAGSLGRSDLTTSITINTAGNIVLGGAASSPTTGVMGIDNGEFARIFSGGDLAISAQIGPQGVGGNITVDTLDVRVGSGAGTLQEGNIGPAGALSFGATGAIDIIGAATMTNAGAGSLFSLVAGQSIDVETASGALMVQDANGGLAGQLELAAPVIRGISDAAAQDISGASIADIDSRLGQNDGAVNDAGYFSAGQLSFTVDDALLIQNSGAGTEFDERRGFTAGTVTINTANPAAVIVVNGAVGGLTGLGALSAAGVPSLFDPGSTINGCLIANPASCGAPPSFEIPVPGFPIQDLIEEEIDPRGDDEPGSEDLSGDDLGGILVDLREPLSRQEDPLLDDPVTGAGNEDLWVSGPDCEGVDADSEACRGPGE